ncbi:MAG: flagellar hook-length control protein FliK [Lachnospiraceae bacterium]|nr:flagellar hook-length control protein FliK [Lachnospiraceae bacterium]
MPINIATSNYINTTTGNTGSGQTVSISGANISVDGVSVSVKGLDLKTGQTISGQVIEVDGKDIKLLLSNNQTINAKLEGNINALLGQTLSFEVKNTEDGLTSLRPLYTNLNNSMNVTNALSSAGLPVTDNYSRMVSAMMDENMPINKQAIHDMSKQINSFKDANPETVVRLTKLGLSVNELTINQFENYKGLERQIIGNVDTIADGFAKMISDSLSQAVKDNNITDISSKINASLAETAEGNVKNKNLLSTFLDSITGQNKDSMQLKADLALVDNEALTGEKIKADIFDTTKAILELINPKDSSDTVISNEMKAFVAEFSNEMKTFAAEFSKEFKEVLNENSGETNSDGNVTKDLGRESILNELNKEILNNQENKSDVIKFFNVNTDKEITGESVLKLSTDLLNILNKDKNLFPDDVKTKLLKLLSSEEFSGLVKDNLSKQMLLKPEEAATSKNIEDLYSKIINNTDKALSVLESLNSKNAEIAEAANNIKENVQFMNELNHAVTYVQLPLLMNNKSAHGDLYVYTNKRSLKNNDGNISALLHLDMDNLGPMDIYVSLVNKTKLNTHFYLQDDETIDFIEKHIDYLNKRLSDKGYDLSMNVSVKNKPKEATDITEEFFKDDPKTQGSVAVKVSFDVRA